MADQRIIAEAEHQRVLQHSRRALNNSLQGQAELRARLDAARQAALQQQRRPGGWSPAYLPWAGGAMLAASLALFVLYQQPALVQPLPDDSADLVMTMAGIDDTEWALVQDLDFLLWLSELDANELENDQAI